jgi:hypothetical protein
MTDFLTETNDNDENKLIELLFDLYGPLMAKDHLWKILGYSSSVAMRVAYSRDTGPLTLIELPHRHGRFALTIEIGKWLCRQRKQNESCPVRWSDTLPRDILENYGILLHEQDMFELFNVGNREELITASSESRLNIPLFTIDQRQKKLFGLAFELNLEKK